MYKWAVRRMIRRSIDAVGRGDIGPTLSGYADDAVLVFPGHGSRWSGEHRGKPAIEAFLRSYLEAGIVGEAHDILVNGPPWRTTVCILFTDRDQRRRRHRVRKPGHSVGRVVWGRVVYHEDFEDTERSEAFEAYLAGQSSTGT